MLDLFLIMTLGFLGSFGHCVGMCGPLAVAFSLSPQPASASNWRGQLYFHGSLNLGRIASYTLVGGLIGALGSVLIASGQLAGIDSSLRRLLTIFTGLLLVWMGVRQINPRLLPQLPFLHPLISGNWHQRLSAAMTNLSWQPHKLTPALLGMTWGLMPCGFLYAAQIKAAETGNIWQGAATMLAFGLGTIPAMLGVGIFASALSADRRSQLFRLGGWITLTIGLLTLLRTGEMTDYTGHAALFCLMLALIARPVSRLWSYPLRYRRGLGVGAFVLSIAHTLHMLEHTFDWHLHALSFMLPVHQIAIWTGILALGLMVPAACTSFDSMLQRLGKRWRQIHLLTMPAFVLAVLHTIAIGSHYLGGLEWTAAHKFWSVVLVAIALLVLFLRCRWFWVLFSCEKFYAEPHQFKPTPTKTYASHCGSSSRDR
ncbi:MAG: sulfite exporter TauE/SafE family protein [Cyanosarcina radialis HA8281-LM2]|nr:sulfite exporter TauE/SafE family protein [Cyanosarcina radialis HA8281-LM2]